MELQGCSEKVAQSWQDLAAALLDFCARKGHALELTSRGLYERPVLLSAQGWMAHAASPTQYLRLLMKAQRFAIVTMFCMLQTRSVMSALLPSPVSALNNICFAHGTQPYSKTV